MSQPAMAARRDLRAVAPTPAPEVRLYSLEAEQAAIGAMLMDERAIEVALLSGDHLLTGAHFHRTPHRQIFQAIEREWDERNPRRLSFDPARPWGIDLVTVGEAMKRSGALDDMGSAGLLEAVIYACPGAANIDRYCATLHRYASLRALCELGERLQAASRNPDAEPDTLIVTVETALLHITGYGTANVRRIFEAIP